MTIARTTTRSILNLRRGTVQCLRAPFLGAQAVQTRFISSATRANSNPCASSTSTPRKTTQRHSELHLLSKAAPARRNFSATRVTAHGDWSPPKAGEELYVTFVDKDGDEYKIAVSKGDNLLDVAQANDIEMEGACGGSCACSTCHVIVEDEALYDRMPEPDDDENDMLDLAFGLTETSRLGCQVIMTQELDGLKVKLPSMTRNLQASDFSKK